MGVTCNIQPLKNCLDLVASICGAPSTQLCAQILVHTFYHFIPNSLMKILYCPHFTDEDTGAQRLKLTQSHMVGKEQRWDQTWNCLMPKTQMSKCISMGQGQCLPPPPPYTPDQQQSFYTENTFTGLTVHLISETLHSNPNRP